MKLSFKSGYVLAMVFLAAIAANAEMAQRVLQATVVTTNTATATLRGEINAIGVVFGSGVSGTVALASSEGTTLFSKSAVTAGTNWYYPRVPIHTTAGAAISSSALSYGGADTPHTNTFLTYGQTPTMTITTNTFLTYGQTPTMTIMTNTFLTYAQTPTVTVTTNAQVVYSGTSDVAIATNTFLTYSTTWATTITTNTLLTYGTTFSQTVTTNTDLSYGTTWTETVTTNSLLTYGLAAATVSTNTIAEYGMMSVVGDVTATFINAAGTTGTCSVIVNYVK